MLRIGITGQSGFIGTHLYNTLSLYKDKYQTVHFEDVMYGSKESMDAFVTKCDVIVHLAAMNRHNDPDLLYTTNIELVQKLIDAMERTNSTPFVIMSSSLQEERDNLYGQSKREGRELLNQWAVRNEAKFIGLIIPNVFGPFGVPFYNSVISTFAHQIISGLEPKVEIDAELKLIYINELVGVIINLINMSQVTLDLPRFVKVDHTSVKKVSELLSQLYEFKKVYQESMIIPDLSTSFDVSLFNTFRSYIPLEFNPVLYTKHTDERGEFVEVMKFQTSGQVSYSTTKPNVTRGNHFHIRKVERFAVIKGKACIKLRKFGTDKVFEFIIDGDNPGYIDMPIWYTHNITNIGIDELITLFWINEEYDAGDPDTYYEKV